MQKWIILFALLSVSLSTVAQKSAVLVRFDARIVEEGIQLNWTIGKGTFCLGLQLERTHDTIDLTTLRSVNEVSGVCGDLSTDVSYSYLDKTPLKNTENHYRLMLGFIPTTFLSVYYADLGNNGILVAPNPAKEYVQFWFVNEKSDRNSLFIYNSMGAVVGQFYNLINDNFTLSTENYPPGFYVYVFRDESNNATTGKLVVVK